VGFIRELLHITKAISSGIITVIGLQAGVLLSGTVITETVFSFPGIGSLIVQAVLSRDLPLLYACVFSISSIWVLVNFLSDKLAQIFDPRLRS
jgi:peptide/nickel transport system permease protein